MNYVRAEIIIFLTCDRIREARSVVTDVMQEYGGEPGRGKGDDNLWYKYRSKRYVRGDLLNDWANAAFEIGIGPYDVDDEDWRTAVREEKEAKALLSEIQTEIGDRLVREGFGNCTEAYDQ